MFITPFSEGCCHLLCCSQCQLPISDNSFRSIQSLMGICLTFGSVEAFYVEDVFGLPPTINFDKQVSLSFMFFGVTLDATTFFIKKGENLDRQTSSKDSMTMNLGKSAASFFEPNSDKFLFFFYLKTPEVMFFFCWSCAPTTHHKVQLVLGMCQKGNPLSLIETGIHNQFI